MGQDEPLQVHLAPQVRPSLDLPDRPAPLERAAGAGEDRAPDELPHGEERHNEGELAAEGRPPPAAAGAASAGTRRTPAAARGPSPPTAATGGAVRGRRHARRHGDTSRRPGVRRARQPIAGGPDCPAAYATMATAASPRTSPSHSSAESRAPGMPRARLRPDDPDDGDDDGHHPEQGDEEAEHPEEGAPGAGPSPEHGRVLRELPEREPGLGERLAAASHADPVPLGEGDGEVGLRPLQAAHCASPERPPVDRAARAGAGRERRSASAAISSSVATSGLPTAARAGRKTPLSARCARCSSASRSSRAGRPLTTTRRQSVVSTSSGEFHRKCSDQAAANPATTTAARRARDHRGPGQGVPETQTEQAGVHGVAPQSAHDAAQQEHLADGGRRVLADGHHVRGVDDVLDDLEAEPDDGAEDEPVDRRAHPPGGEQRGHDDAEPLEELLVRGPRDGRAPAGGDVGPLGGGEDRLDGPLAVSARPVATRPPQTAAKATSQAGSARSSRRRGWPRAAGARRAPRRAG